MTDQFVVGGSAVGEAVVGGIYELTSDWSTTHVQIFDEPPGDGTFTAPASLSDCDRIAWPKGEIVKLVRIYEDCGWVIIRRFNQVEREVKPDDSRWRRVMVATRLDPCHEVVACKLISFKIMFKPIPSLDKED